MANRADLQKKSGQSEILR